MRLHARSMVETPSIRIPGAVPIATTLSAALIGLAVRGEPVSVIHVQDIAHVINYDLREYFRELLATNPDINEGLSSLLRLCRETMVRLQRTESALVRSLERDSMLRDCVEGLMTISVVGPITALT